jgi:hypothetical protein
MKHLYLSKEFAREARRAGLDDDGLRDAVDRAERGIVDAELGSGLIKQRVARPGKGRSGGFRTVIAYRRGTRAIFLHMFPKSRKANLDAAELEDLKDIAKPLMRLSDEQLRTLAITRGWREIERQSDGQEKDLS